MKSRLWRKPNPTTWQRRIGHEFCRSVDMVRLFGARPGYDCLDFFRSALRPRLLSPCHPMPGIGQERHYLGCKFTGTSVENSSCS